MSSNEFPLQHKWAFQVTSYQRLVSLKYRDYLVEGTLPILQESLLVDLEALTQEPSPEETILRIYEIMRKSTRMMHHSPTNDHGIRQTQRKIIEEIQNCRSLQALQQLLFLVDPTAAIHMADLQLAWGDDAAPREG